MQRQDIKTMIERLDDLSTDLDMYDHSLLSSTITMLEELGNLVHDLQLDNESLKQDILHLEAMIDD